MRKSATPKSLQKRGNLFNYLLADKCNLDKVLFFIRFGGEVGGGEGPDRPGHFLLNPALGYTSYKGKGRAR